MSLSWLGYDSFWIPWALSYLFSEIDNTHTLSLSSVSVDFFFYLGWFILPSKKLFISFAEAEPSDLEKEVLRIWKTLSEQTIVIRKKKKTRN